MTDKIEQMKTDQNMILEDFEAAIREDEAQGWIIEIKEIEDFNRQKAKSTDELHAIFCAALMIATFGVTLFCLS